MDPKVTVLQCAIILQVFIPGQEGEDQVRECLDEYPSTVDPEQVLRIAAIFITELF